MSKSFRCKSSRSASPGSLDSVFASIQPRLSLVEEFIFTRLSTEIETVQDIGTYVINGGGKRLRPAVLLTIARMLGYQGDRDVRYGAVVEMIHSASLVHDDIIDHAATRRGRPTANRRCGNMFAVLLGDWLYNRSIELALEIGDLEIMRILSQATTQMIEGEILALELRRKPDITVEQYLDIARRKTAEVFAAACAIPSCFSPELTRFRPALEQYGRNLGISFQLVDDLLDITGSQQHLGKPVFSDLAEGRFTLPFILLRPLLPDSERSLIDKTLFESGLLEESSNHLRRLLGDHHVLRRTRGIAADYAGRAIKATRCLPGGPERDALINAATFVLERDH